MTRAAILRRSLVGKSNISKCVGCRAHAQGRTARMMQKLCVCILSLQPKPVLKCGYYTPVSPTECACDIEA